VVRLRRYLTSITITPVGGVLLGGFVVALGFFAFGPSGAQAPAMIAAVILLIGLLGGVPFGIAGGRGEPRREFIPTDRRDLGASNVDSQAEEVLWRKERERREQDGRSN
jgi:hypothetical protein